MKNILSQNFFEDPVALNKEYEIICCKYFIPSITERI